MRIVLIRLPGRSRIRVRAVMLAPVGTTEGGGRGSRWLSPRRVGLGLSGEALAVLANALPELPVDGNRVRVRFGFTATASAFALGRWITLDATRYTRLDARQQLGLVAHELVHVAQYAALGAGGVPRFLVRYAPDYFTDPDNYRIPSSLTEMPLAELTLLEPQYTLDQIAERFRHELLRRWTSV